MKHALLGLCLYTLITSYLHAGQLETIEVETLVATGASWDGNPLPGYPTGEPEVTILRISIPAGFEIPLHKHPVINAGVLLKGSLTVMTEDDETLHLESGDSIVEVVDKWHSGRNEGNVTAEIIVFYAGVKGTPLSIKPKP